MSSNPITTVTAVTPTISTSAYQANDAVGGRMTFAIPASSAAVGGGGSVLSLTVIDLSGQNAALNLFLFDQPFTATADSAVFAPSAADLANCLGVIQVQTSDYVSAGANGSVATVKGVGLAVRAINTAALLIYAQAMTTGTPTYALSALTFKLGLYTD